MKEDWVEVELGEITEINPKLVNKDQIDGELEVQFIPMKLVEEVSNKIHLNEIRKFNDIQKMSYTYFAEDDVLFAKVTPCMENGKIAIAKNLKNGIGYGSSEFHIFRCSQIILNNYLFYYLIQEAFRSDAQYSMTGAVGLRRVPKIFLEKYKLPLPPLPIQRAIVSKIETLFSDLDKGIADLKKAQEQLKIYRQAVLKKAFEGELTREWRELHKQKREDWNRLKLDDVLKTIDGDRGKNYPKKNEFLNEGYCLFLSTKNVRVGEFIFEDNLFITKEKDAVLRGGKLERNDVVITTRGTLGNVALYDDSVTFEHIRINSGMLILRVNDEQQLSQHFLMRFINSSLFFQQLKSKQTGTAQPQIPARILREIEIDIPIDVSEQKQIIKEIESRLSVCDKVEQNISEALDTSEALRQSILKKAFVGKLLSEAEIEACRREADYEPASVLLERIRKESPNEK